MKTIWQDESLESFDGLQLYGCHASPQKPKARILLLHGYGEQTTPYQEIAQKWLESDFAVCMYDLRGHGRSGGYRGFTQRFEDYLDDFDLIFARVQDQQQSLPVFLLGQDLGALIAAAFATSRRHVFAGLILCAIPFQLPLTPMQLMLGSILSYVSPRRPLGPKKMASLAFGDKVATSADQGFQIDGMPCRVSSEILKAGRQLLSDADNILGPLLMINGVQDAYHSEDMSQQLYERAMSFDKARWQVEKAEHRLLDRQDSYGVSQRIREWMNERYARPMDADAVDSRPENF